MSEVVPEMPNACAVACPTAAARSLGELARQYTEPETWLFSDPEEREVIGVFSVDAVRTVVNNYNVAGPADHPRYGTPYDYLPHEMVVAGTMQRSIQMGAHLNPKEISLLQDTAQGRTDARNKFADLSVRERQRRAEAAKPFLEDVAVTLLDKNPDLAELQELATILEGREQADETLSLARDLVNSVKHVDRVHMLDQAPFFIARQALQACGGPMAFSRPRFVVPVLAYPIGTATGQVCPNGSKRNMDYFTASHQYKRQ
jgi:hypothetical protein